jgi:predicted nucleic acid-binding protein
MDTGPLVAFLDVRDSAHVLAAECLSTFTGHLITTSAVIVEAMYFVSAIPEGPEALASFVHAARILVHESTQPFQLKEAVRLMDKYSDTPMDFADATLVLLADRLNTYEIATLDRRGFSTYRTPRGKSFRLVIDK